MITEFKTFLLRRNILDLAVSVVIGAAFGAVIAAFVEDLITPLIAALFGRRESPADPTTRKCSECPSEIPVGARRCAFRTSPVAA